jgi:hypothetical protein
VCPCADLSFRTSTNGQDEVLKSRSGGLPRVNTKKKLKKKKKRVLGFKFLGFLGDGFGVKEKKKAGTGGLCPTVTGTH